MTKLATAIEFETTYGTYRVDEIIGDGGSGRVYGGTGLDQNPIAVKVLNDKTSAEKRKRFKNELGYLTSNSHPNIVTALDHGFAQVGKVTGPFYVMRRYQSSLRELMRAGIPHEKVLPYFSQILNGVEAAHLQGVVHRDLKPENILYDQSSDTLAIADFGTARFIEHLMVTSVETGPAKRLANFQYAAPEQRTPGTTAGVSADIWALGSILNEMFTGNVPHGTGYRTISDIAPELGFLDGIVSKAIRQSPGERQASVEEMKTQIMKYQFESVTLQRLNSAKTQVIEAKQIDDDLTITPPRLVDAVWNRGQLTLTLDRPVSGKWVQAFYNMGSYRSIMGAEPGRFVFQGSQTTISVSEHQAQAVVDYFRGWLPNASAVLRGTLEAAERERRVELENRLRQEREAEEQNLRVNRALRV